MRLDDGSAEGSAGQFHTTRWTLVLVLAQKEGQAAQAALAELCQIYWYPLYALSAEDVINFCTNTEGIESHPGAHSLPRGGGECDYHCLHPLFTNRLQVERGRGPDKSRRRKCK